MIPRRGVLLLVGVLVFLIDNHQAQPLEGQEYRGTHTEYHVVFLPAQLLLPYLHPFGIGELGVIHAQAIAEHSFQSFGDLSGQGNFGQQIEYLLSLLQSLLDEVDIDFRLSARCYPVKQADVLLPETSSDFIERPLLGGIERIDFGFLQTGFVQPTDFLIIDLEDAFFHQSVENTQRSSCLFEQGFLGYFLQITATSRPTGKLDVFHQQGKLFLGSRQFVEKLLHRFLIPFRTGKPYPRLGLRFVAALQVLLHENGFLVEQSFDYGEYSLDATRLLKLGYALLPVSTEQVEQLLFVLRERFGSLEVLVIFHHRLALQLHTRWHGGFIDIAQRAEVIGGKPLPKAELEGKDDGSCVQHFLDVLRLEALRRRSVYLCHDGGVELLHAERHHDATTHLHALLQFRGQRVSVLRGNGQGHYDIHELLHAAKVQKRRHSPTEMPPLYLVRFFFLLRKCMPKKPAKSWSWHRSHR